MVYMLGDTRVVELGVAIVSAFYMFTGLASPLLGTRLSKLSLYISTIASLLILALLGGIITETGYARILDGAIVLDQFTLYLLFIGTIVVGLATMALNGVVDKWESGDVYYAVVGLLALGLLVAGLAGLLYLAYTAWILVAISSYILVALYKDDTSAEAALKYAIVGSIATIILLLAVQLYYGVAQSSSIGAPVQVESTVLVLPIIVFTLVSIGFKMGVVPFHSWIADVYGNARPVTVSIVSALAKVFAVILLVKLIVPYTSTVPQLLLASSATIAVITMFIGNLGGLTTVHDSPQKLLAYSSIAQAGYLLAGISLLAKIPGVDNTAALAGIALHTANYALTKFASFTLLEKYCEYPGCSWRPIRGLLWRNPVAASALTIALAGLIGAPPTLGFWGKLYITLAAISASTPLAILLVANFAIASFYYGYFIYQLFQPSPKPIEKTKPNKQEWAALIAAILSLILGLAPTLAYGLTVYGYNT